MWFQQEDAKCRTVRETIKLLHETFPGHHLFDRFGDQKWSPRSCDLTPLDLFLWGCIEGGNSTLHQRNSARFMWNGNVQF